LSFRDKLNPPQREAVETTDGPLLILAGAGSGKTRVITYRIAHLIENLGVEPDSILAVTFTNKAAQEMAQRVDQMVGGRRFAKPLISTFHSFCVRALRRDIEKLQLNGKGLTRQFVIYDETDQQSVVKAAMRRLGLDDKWMKPNAVLSQISWAKNHMIDPEEFFLGANDPKREKIAYVFREYKQTLAKSNALDFDDLLLEAVRLLKAVPEVREYYNRRFHYLLVDEYQDTNRPQYEMLRLLAGERQNVCAVGDEDQSIYSWRGADIRNILEFERDFPRARIIRLEQNYRSTQNILQAASAVVANNLQRKGKTLWTARQGGARIGCYEAPDGENEALFVADYLSKYVAIETQEGRDARAAILYRTNSQSRLFEEGLRRYGLKYNVVGGFSFYERAEIKDLVSYLKVLHNPDDSIAVQRVINTPARGIGKSTLEVIERIALETGTSTWAAIETVMRRQLLPARALTALRGFRQIIAEARAMLAGLSTEPPSEAANPEPIDEPAALSLAEEEEQVSFDLSLEPEETSNDVSFDFGAPPAEAPRAEFPVEDSAQFESEGIAAYTGPANIAELLKFLLDRTGYIKQLEADGSPEAQARIENLHELVNAAMDAQDRGEALGEFLDHAALVSDQDSYDTSAQITLMTLHAAKGLEFPLVFLVGLEEGLFPHSRTLNSPNELEEERRLCYVGMTRAMDMLVLARARYRRRWGTDMPEASVPSRFLDEVPPRLLEDLGSPRGAGQEYTETTGSHYNYEDEDQRPAHERAQRAGSARTAARSPAYNSIENIAEFFASRGKKFSLPKMPVVESSGARGFRPGQKVRHPKYGVGVVYQCEGDGDNVKITVQFQRFGLKKLMEKFAQLERA
jgi:DNA helicase-2/ATP-dependent DNA helicase PcrA